MANRLEIIVDNNIQISTDMIQIIAEDFIEWQNE